MRESKENNRQERRTHQISNKINQKRRKKNSPSLINISSSPTIVSFDTTYFPLLLAAGVRHGRTRAPPLLRLLLRRLRSQIVLNTSSQSLPASLLSLLPLLLLSSSPSVTSLTAEVAGLVSLNSIEQNEIIASDDQILKGLIQSLTSGSQKSVKAALNAVMDLSVSSFARDRLRDAGFINKLLYIVSQIFDISQDSDRGIFGRNKLLNLFLEAATTLINTSKIDFTELIISSELIQKILPLFSKINKINGLNLNPKLAETIFRLSINLPNPTFLDLNELKFTIFGRKISNFNEFLSNYWEKSPFLIKNGFNKNCNEDNSIFNSLINKWKNTTNILDLILNDLISCPNISPDELDINNFLIETRSFLTSKLIYNQDIKIVKTEGPNCKSEKHFPNIEKYKDAYKEGYSIALKGMQFRNDQIALLSITLSKIFGLPSIGVNLYLSPGGAQGLARHYDDHCVLICQIIGSKFWRIFKNPIPILPRLYEQFNCDFKNEVTNEDMMEILVQEGDVLYIPRGYFHEACTDLDASCSLHLTLAIEVDRPFEWEGFVHIALHCWYEKFKQNLENILLNSKFECTNITFYLLLHISIKLIGDHDPIFRKACLVASEISSQKSIFDQIISKINEKSNFLDAFNWIKLVCEKRDEDSLQCLRWLKHLDQSENEIDFCNLLETLEKYVMPCRGQMNEVMEEFDDFKGCFCKYVVYEDVCVSFGKLLEKYRKGRGQYMKGMLGLHRRY